MNRHTATRARLEAYERSSAPEILVGIALTVEGEEAIKRCDTRR
jgi:hypothetical protein